MIVLTLQGIPFYCDPSTRKIYAYEKVQTHPLLELGTYDPEKETFQLRPDWKTVYAPHLENYRTSIQVRSRLPVAPS